MMGSGTRPGLERPLRQKQLSNTVRDTYNNFWCRATRDMETCLIVLGSQARPLSLLPSQVEPSPIAPLRLSVRCIERQLYLDQNSTTGCLLLNLELELWIAEPALKH